MRMMRKVLFLIESLGGGGAEKVLATIVKYINKKKFDVTVCVISGGGRYEKEVEREVRLHAILKSPSSYRGAQKIWYWIKYKMIYNWLPERIVYGLFVPKRNDVEVAFVEGFATRLLASSTNKHAKKIAWVHCDLENQPWPISCGVYKDLKEEKMAYGRYDTVACVSKRVEDVMREYYGVSNAITIYNPIDMDRIRDLAFQKCDWQVDTSKYNIVSVGRLEVVKGYDKLVSIVCDIRNVGVDVHLWLIGEGAEGKNLRCLVKDMGMESNVTFTDFLTNPYSLMSQMDFFVFSSKAEGVSLVILEAILLGLPVISMNCGGPRELIYETGGGVLFDSYEELC